MNPAAAPQPVPARPLRHSIAIVVLVRSVDDEASQALSTAMSMSAGRPTAIHVQDPHDVAHTTFVDSWERWGPGVTLVSLLGSPDAATAITDYLLRRHRDQQIVIILPAPMTAQAVDHDARLTAALGKVPNIAVCHAGGGSGTTSRT